MNSPLDNHERRISHSLYESIDGSDNSIPLTNMIGRIGELSARFYHPPSSASLCLFLLDKIEFFFHIDGQCGWPANLMLIGYFFSWIGVTANWYSTINFNIHPGPFWIVSASYPKPASPPKPHASHCPAYAFTIQTSQGLTSSPIFSAFTPLLTGFNWVNSHPTQLTSAAKILSLQVY